MVGILIVAGCGLWFFIGLWVQEEVFEFIDKKEATPFNFLLLMLLGTLGPIPLAFFLATKGVKAFFRIFSPLVQGVSLMKRKLFATLFLFALGGEVLPSIGYRPQLFDRVMAWWNAPPAPPSPEAQKLIASLEDGKGWRMSQVSALLVRGDITITPGCETAWPWEKPQAFIDVNGAKVSEQFSKQDRALISVAAEKCLRKLTARSLETTAAQ